MAQQPMYPAVANSIITELAADVTNSSITITVVNGASLPSGPNLITIGWDETAETVLYTAKSGNTLTGCTRGFGGTIARPWGTTSRVARYFTAADHESFRKNILDVAGEVETARTGAGPDYIGYDSLPERLEAEKAEIDSRIDDANAQLADIASETAGQIAALDATKAGKDEVNTLATAKVDVTYFNTQIANIGNGSPKGTYATLAALQAAYPTGANGIYIVSFDGNWYYWNGSAWSSGGVYQSTGVPNRSLSPAKLDINFGFYPVTSAFAKRTVNNTGDFVASVSRYTSDYLLIKSEYIITNADPMFEIAVRLFDSAKNTLTTSAFTGQQIDISAIYAANPTATQFLIYVANAVDKVTIADGLGDHFSSTIYVKTNSYPASVQALTDQHYTIQKYRLASWFDRFPRSNFDKSVLITDDNAYLKLGSDISTTTLHKWLLYAKTDEQRKVYSVKGKFLAASTGGTETNRIFVESSDGRVVFFIVSTAIGGVLEAYSLNKTTGAVSILPLVVPSVTYTYPTSATLITFDVVLVGKTAFLYVDGVMYRAYDLAGQIGDKINKAGVSYRGNVAQQMILTDFDIQYRPEKLLHISFDDTFSLLKQLTTSADSYASLFDHSTFAFLRDMHNTYGAVFTFFLFYARTDDTFTMANVPTKFKAEFTANASWLKFGYHSQYEDTRSANLSDADLVTNVAAMHTAITNFAGADSIDRIVRFGYFSVNQSALIALHDAGLILGALTADDNRTDNCGLTGGPLAAVQSYYRYTDIMHGISYFRTETRFDGTSGETLVGRLNRLYIDPNNNEQYILFAHSVLTEPITAALEWAYKKGDIRFDFPISAT